MEFIRRRRLRRHVECRAAGKVNGRLRGLRASQTSVSWFRVKALRRFTVRAHLPERLAALDQLSTNLRWSWDKPTQDLFATIDPALWTRCSCDPVELLGAVNPVRLDELALDEGFLGRLDEL